MTVPSQPEDLRQLQSQIEGLLQSLHHPVLVENEVELMDLTAAQWRLTVEFGKLIFSAWNSANPSPGGLRRWHTATATVLESSCASPEGAKPPRWSFANCARRAA